MEKSDCCSRVQYGKYILTVSVLLLLILLVPASAQTRLSTKEKFDKGQSLFYLSTTREAQDLFMDLMGPLCENESVYVECVDAQILVDIIKRNKTDFASAEQFLNDAQELIGK